MGWDKAQMFKTQNLASHISGSQLGTFGICPHLDLFRISDFVLSASAIGQATGNR
jgi:hypothetical protein